MCGEFWRYLLMDLSTVLPRKSYISVGFSVHVKAQWLLSEVKYSTNDLPEWRLWWCGIKTMAWNRERGGESQLPRVTGKCHKKQLGHGVDQIRSGEHLVSFISVLLLIVLGDKGITIIKILSSLGMQYLADLQHVQKWDLLGLDCYLYSQIKLDNFFKYILESIFLTLS